MSNENKPKPPLIERMICRPHQHGDKTYAAGDWVSASPAHIHIMDNMGVLVSAGKEKDFVVKPEAEGGTGG